MGLKKSSTDPRLEMIRDGWRQCAEGQKTTQFCALLEAAILAERERCAEIARSIDENGLSNYGAVIALRILGKDST